MLILHKYSEMESIREKAAFGVRGGKTKPDTLGYWEGVERWKIKLSTDNTESG